MRRKKKLPRLPFSSSITSVGFVPQSCTLVPSASIPRPRGAARWNAWMHPVGPGGLVSALLDDASREREPRLLWSTLISLRGCEDGPRRTAWYRRLRIECARRIGRIGAGMPGRHSRISRQRRPVAIPSSSHAPLSSPGGCDVPHAASPAVSSRRCFVWSVPVDPPAGWSSSSRTASRGMEIGMCAISTRHHPSNSECWLQSTPRSRRGWSDRLLWRPLAV